MPEKKMGRFRASYLLAAESFEFLRQDKEMVWLPVRSFFANMLVALICIAIYFGVMFWFGPADMEAPMTLAEEVFNYAVIFLMYLGSAFVFTYYQGAIATMVHMRINGQDPTLKDGTSNSRKHVRKILKWAAFSATVGVIINLLHDKFGWAGKLLGVVGSVAWSVLTFFMVPVLVLEEKTIKGSLGRSGQLFKETWGETLVMNFSLGAFFTALHLMWMVLCLIVAVLFIESMSALIFIIVLFFMVFIGLAVLNVVLSGIFKTVLYEYAASGRVPASFTPQLIMGAVKSTSPAPATSPSGIV